MAATAINPLQGRCPRPFLQLEKFGNDTGFIDGRLCQSMGVGVSCCVPCPVTDWLYPDSFNTVITASEWINVVGLICCVFVLLSFLVLPVEKTHRHYLSICLVIAVSFMQLGFVIPLGANPDQCADEITPHGMHSSRTCAISGAFILAGGWCAVMWVFMRALALHLQICWQVVMGKSFMYGTLIGGWGIPAIALTLAMVFSGVSFRFGETCHINHTNSLADFWIPLLVFAGLTVIIQFSTFGYCIKVYLASLADGASTTNSSGLPSYQASVITMTPRQAYRRVKRVVELQWRGIAIVLLIITDVIFFSVVFVMLDNNQTSVSEDKSKTVKWIACQLANAHKPVKEAKEICLTEAKDLVTGLATVTAVLVLLSANGIWLLLLMGRISMFTGWWDLVKSKVKPNREFVSADAARSYSSKDPRTYEMLGSPGRDRDFALKADMPLTPLSPAAQPTYSKSGRETPDYFGREAKYQNPSHSFSSPRPPPTRDWDPAATNAASAYHHRIDPLGMNKI